MLAAAKAAFAATFGKTDVDTGGGSPFLSWIGCRNVVEDRSDCEGANVVSEVPVDIGFVPTLALAAKLDVRGEGVAGALARFDVTRDAARNVSGRFRTNTIPIESVSPLLWRASSKWKQRSAAGFAVRSPNQTGDWHIFDADSAQDGYGQYTASWRDPHRHHRPRVCGWRL